MQLYPYIIPFYCVYTTRVNDIQGQRYQNRTSDRKLFPDMKKDTAGTSNTFTVVLLDISYES